MAAKFNELTKRNIKPIFDMYRLSVEELQEILTDIIQKKFGVHAEFYIYNPDSNPNPRALEICFVDPDELDEDVVDKMQDDGLNPDDNEDVTNKMLFYLGGEQDMWGEYLGGDDEELVDLYINPRQDIELKILDVQKVALKGTREDTIMAIQKLLKEVRK